MARGTLHISHIHKEEEEPVKRQLHESKEHEADLLEVRNFVLDFLYKF